ncbi:MAG: hypothetical protein WC707_02500 [Candidatus Babeliaceae bacterium]|jgi:hypothetical protein
MNSIRKKSITLLVTLSITLPNYAASDFFSSWASSLYTNLYQPVSMDSHTLGTFIDICIIGIPVVISIPLIGCVIWQHRRINKLDKALQEQNKIQSTILETNTEIIATLKSFKENIDPIDTFEHSDTSTMFQELRKQRLADDQDFETKMKELLATSNSSSKKLIALEENHKKLELQLNTSTSYFHQESNNAKKIYNGLIIPSLDIVEQLTERCNAIEQYCENFNKQLKIIEKTLINEQEALRTMQKILKLT